MADLVLNDSFTLSDSIQVGRGNRVSDQITLSDSVVVELGPVLVTQLPVEVSSQTPSQVISSQVPVEVLTPTLGLIQLLLSDSFTLSDSIRIGRGLDIQQTLTMTDAASVVMSAPLTLNLSDSFTLTDNVQTRLPVRLNLDVSDTMTLSDSVTTLLSIPMRQMSQLAVEVLNQTPSLVRMTQGPVEIITPRHGLIQLNLSDSFTLTDALAKSLSVSLTRSVSDTLTMSDSFIYAFVTPLVLSDNLNQWADSITTSVATPIALVLSDDLNQWNDSSTNQLNAIVFLTETFSDSMDFWGDSFQYELVFHPRDVPTGDPTKNCCPPNIFITD